MCASTATASLCRRRSLSHLLLCRRSCHYTGKLASTGAVFDSSYGRRPLQFKVCSARPVSLAQRMPQVSSRIESRFGADVSRSTDTMTATFWSPFK